MLAAGGVADGDGSRQADLKGFASTGVPAFLIEREEIGIRGRANRRPTKCADSVCKAGIVGAWIIIDIQLYVSPPADMSERGCQRKHPRFGLFRWTVGWWEVF